MIVDELILILQQYRPDCKIRIMYIDDVEHDIAELNAFYSNDGKRVILTIYSVK